MNCKIYIDTILNAFSFELYNYDIPTSLIFIYDGLYYHGRLNQRWFNVGQPSAMTVHYYLSTAYSEMLYQEIMWYTPDAVKFPKITYNFFNNHYCIIWRLIPTCHKLFLKLCCAYII